MVVEEHEIGREARRDPAVARAKAEEGRGRARRHVQRRLQRQPEDADGVADGGRHVEMRAGERPLLRHEPPVGQTHAPPEERERARISEPDGRHGVGDQHQPLPCPWRRCATRSVVADTCSKSTMRLAKASGSSSAAPTGPGSREDSGGMALKRCVKPVSPAARAAATCSAVATVWPAETITPADASFATVAGGTSSGASVTSVLPPVGAERSATSASSMRADVVGAMHAGLLRADERPLDMNAEDARHPRRDGRARRVDRRAP